MTLVKAQFGPVEFWAQTWGGPDGRRIVSHEGYGRSGASTEDTGSSGRNERITALLTVAEYNTLRILVHKAEVRQFTHPLLGAWRCRCNIGSRSSTEDDEKISVELEFPEDTDQPPASPFDDDSPNSKKNRAASNYDDAKKKMATTPGDADTQALMAEYNTAWDDYEGQVDEYEGGAVSVEDVDRALDALKAKGWAVITDLGTFQDYEKAEGAYAASSAIARTLLACHEYVESIRQTGTKWFHVQATATTDIWTLAMEVNALANVEKVMKRNDVLDGFYIESGTVLEFPV